MRILYHGPLWYGSTSSQRVKAFCQFSEIEVIESNNAQPMGTKWSLYARIRWKLRWPLDIAKENLALIQKVAACRPDIVMIDNSKVISRSTLNQIRQICKPKLVYYSPDDVMQAHNVSHPLRLSLPEWDIFFTTKTFNIPELRQAGVKRPLLVGKSFDPVLHSPMSPEEVGEEYESFDLVFIGSFERERCRSINALAEAGFRIVVYGEGLGRWNYRRLHPSIRLRPPVFAEEYRRCWHHGKLALCFLRKINRDKITQRTMEIAAMARPFMAEKTDEHDAHFEDGKEYVAFSNDDELIRLCKHWLVCDEQRRNLGLAARQRCHASRYSTLDRAKWMIEQLR